MRLTWKDVLDCKTGATPTISDAELLADKARYKMFCFNEMIFAKAVIDTFDKRTERWVYLPFLKSEDL